MASRSQPKVVLFYPPYAGKPLGPPLGLLNLATPLLNAGIRVRIIDAAIEPNYQEVLAAEIPSATCFGVSLLTGPMILHAINASRQVRGLRPGLPIVYGGWHPTLLPEQTLREEFVDAVVRGQGELTFLEVVERWSESRSLEGVAGVSYKDGDRIVHNPDRPVASINSLPTPAYSLVDFGRYEKACGLRKTVYASSVGCPYACNYCTDTVFYQRLFNALSPERVVREVISLVGRHQLSEVSFLDSNFPVNVRRALAIARGFLESGVRFRWTFQASTDLIARMSDEDVLLLGRSGVSHIGFGVESGSREVLDWMNKPHQRVDDMFETARKCERAGIKTTFNLIIGYPGETDAHRAETFRVMGELCRRHPTANFSPNIFTPYPAIPIWPRLSALGVTEPQSLKEWAGMSLGSNFLPWLRGEEYRRSKRMLSCFLLYHQLRRGLRGRNAFSLARKLQEMLLAWLDWRLRRRFYRLPLELWVAALRKHLTVRRSLLTGQGLGADLEGIS
ncbi:MAG: radical SAM protein [Acidobacteriota bacterium]